MTKRKISRVKKMERGKLSKFAARTLSRWQIMNQKKHTRQSKDKLVLSAAKVKKLFSRLAKP